MFVPIAGKIVGGLIQKRFVKPGASVIDMGNQTYSVSQGVIHELLAMFGGDSSLTKEYSVLVDELKSLSKAEVASKPKEVGTPHVETFYKALGFSSYSSIDINSDFGSMVMDLNKNLATEYNFVKQYDLVTNIGVSEHLFDQNTFFKNAHNLTAVGGVMMHILPFLGYVNHGFFNYEPRIFYDLAAANGYDLLTLYLADREYIILDLTKQNEILTHFYQYLEPLVPNDYHNGFVVAVMKKNTSEDFVTPLQGKYVQDIDSPELEERYNSRKKQDSVRGFSL